MGVGAILMLGVACALSHRAAHCRRRSALPLEGGNKHVLSLKPHRGIEASSDMYRHFPCTYKVGDNSSRQMLHVFANH